MATTSISDLIKEKMLYILDKANPLWDSPAFNGVGGVIGIQLFLFNGDENDITYSTGPDSGYKSATFSYSPTTKTFVQTGSTSIAVEAGKTISGFKLIFETTAAMLPHVATYISSSTYYFLTAGTITISGTEISLGV